MTLKLNYKEGKKKEEEGEESLKEISYLEEFN